MKTKKSETLFIFYLCQRNGGVGKEKRVVKKTDFRSGVRQDIFGEKEKEFYGREICLSGKGIEKAERSI